MELADHRFRSIRFGCRRPVEAAKSRFFLFALAAAAGQPEQPEQQAESRRTRPIGKTHVQRLDFFGWADPRDQASTFARPRPGDDLATRINHCKKSRVGGPRLPTIGFDAAKGRDDKMQQGLCSVVNSTIFRERDREFSAITCGRPGQYRMGRDVADQRRGPESLSRAKTDLQHARSLGRRRRAERAEGTADESTAERFRPHLDEREERGLEVGGRAYVLTWFGFKEDRDIKFLML